MLDVSIHSCGSGHSDAKRYSFVCFRSAGSRPIAFHLHRLPRADIRAPYKPGVASKSYACCTDMVK